MASEGREFVNLVRELGGEEAAELLMLEYAGSRVSIPVQRLSATNWLVQLVGLRCADEIVKQFGGGLIEIPLAEAGSAARNRREIRRRLKQGESVDHIARHVGVNRRTVQRQRLYLRQIDRHAKGRRTEGPFA